MVLWEKGKHGGLWYYLQSNTTLFVMWRSQFSKSYGVKVKFMGKSLICGVVLSCCCCVAATVAGVVPSHSAVCLTSAVCCVLPAPLCRGSLPKARNWEICLSKALPSSRVCKHNNKDYCMWLLISQYIVNHLVLLQAGKFCKLQLICNSIKLQNISFILATLLDPLHLLDTQ